MISFNCPTCGKPLQIAPEHGGQAVQCPGCQGRISVPRALAPVPPPIQAEVANRPPLLPSAAVHQTGPSTSTILLIVGGVLFGGCGLLAILVVVCLAAITTIGSKADVTFEKVGNSLSSGS